MARRQPDLRTRTARAKLSLNRDHTATVATGVALIWRRADRKQAGAWRVRKVDRRKDAGYSFGRLGAADDVADGLGLSYQEAAAAALTWNPPAGAPVAAGAGDCARCGKKLAEGGPLAEMPDYSAPEPPPGDQRPRVKLHQKCYLVRDAVDEYMEVFAATFRSADRARYALEAHVLPALGDTAVLDLEAHRVREFQEALAARPALLAGRRGSPSRKVRAAVTEEQQRARRVSANTIMAKLKSALNRAVEMGRVPQATRERWTIKPLETGAPEEPRWLEHDEAVRLLNVIDDDDLRHLVHGLLLTGARVGEAKKLCVSHFSPEAGTVTIPASISKVKKARSIALTEEAVALFEQLTAGRPVGARIFTHRGRPWSKDGHQHPLAKAFAAAGIQGANLKSMRHTFAAWLKLSGRVSSAEAAAVLGHSVAMYENTYGRIGSNRAGKAVRDALPRLTAPKPQKVAPIQRNQRRA